MDRPTSQQQVTSDRSLKFPINHRRVLSTLDTDLATSSENSPGEEEVDEVQQQNDDTEEGHSIIGVSIGERQDRLRAPKTPAAEKEEALRGQDPFDIALRDYEPDHQRQTAHRYNDQRYGAPSETRDRAQGASNASQYSPRLNGSRHDGPDDETRRSRAATGPLQPRRTANFNLPSFQTVSTFAKSNRFSLPSIDGALNWVRGPGHHDAKPLPSRTNHPVERQNAAEPSTTAPWVPYRRSSIDSVRDPSRTFMRQESTPYPLLRRTTSDGSLNIGRTASLASSLGDDTRWEDVSEQVNSRMKAIKDSWADSNFRMPKFRANWLDSVRLGEGTDWRRTQQRNMSNLRGLTGNRSNQALSAPRDVPTSPPSGMSKSSTESHPQFMKALQNLTGDVVVMGGYRGSVLRSADPPNRQLWIPVKVGLNIRKVNLEVGLDLEDEEHMPRTIIPSGMLKHIGPVEISRRLFKRLRSCPNAVSGHLRVWDYGYDWRLSPRLLSRQLEAYLETLPCNKPGTPADRRGATVIAHSLGGLITRHVANRRPELFSGVVYAGVPQTCVNILGPLRNGDEVLLSSKVLTAQTNFTIRTSFALLPLNGDCFVDEETRESYNVDFFDPKTWEEYRLSPCIARPLPPWTREPEKMGSVSSLVGSMASVLPSVNVRRNSLTKRFARNGSPARGWLPQSTDLHSEKTDEPTSTGTGYEHRALGEPMSTQMNHLSNPQEYGESEELNVSTAVTIPKDRAMRYLSRTLAEVKAFKEELAYKPSMEDKYPPAAVIYGKSVPTVCGAKVKGREAIKHADAFNHLQFASGDGVVLARAAQIPEGYHVAPGGVVKSDRGHISLLGDLEAVGSCLNALSLERRRRRYAIDANVKGDANS